MDFLKKLQNLPLKIKKIILWLIVISLGISLVWFWTKSFNKRLKGFPKENFIEELKIPFLKEKIKEDIPKLELPQNLSPLESSD